MDFNISNLIMNIGENTKGIDWVNPMAVLITGIVTSFISLFIANKSNKLQQEQFKEQQRQILKAPYIQREAEIIIAFRGLVYKSQNAFLWFSDLLKPYRIMNKISPEQDVKLKDESLIVKFKDYCENYDILNELNIFYNNNQMILKKNNIEEDFIYITAILRTITLLNNQDDFHYDFISEDDTCVKYKLNVINKIGKTFVSSIDLENFYKKSSLNVSGEELFKLVNPQNLEEKLLEYSNNIYSVYVNLTRKLDEITTFYDGDLPDNLKMIKIHSFPNSEKFIEIINKKGGQSAE